MTEPTREVMIRDRLRQLLDSQLLAVLSTAGATGPYASLIAFAATQDLSLLLFATPRTTRKFANLTAQPAVGLLVDNRTNQGADFQAAQAATILGQAREVDRAERPELERLYLAKHPHLEEFVRAPSTALIQVTVQSYYLVERFQEVMELHVKP